MTMIKSEKNKSKVIRKTSRNRFMSKKFLKNVKTLEKIQEQNYYHHKMLNKELSECKKNSQKSPFYRNQADKNS